MPLFNGRQYDAPIFEFLVEDTDPTNNQVIGDYSGATKYFLTGPPATEIWALTQMIVGLEGTGKFLSQNYADKSVPLPVGICLEKSNALGESLLALVPLERPIHSNADWSYRCHEAIPSPLGSPTGNSNSFLSVRWSLSESGTPLILDGSKGETLRAVLNDDFVGIVQHTYHCHGFKVEQP